MKTYRICGKEILCMVKSCCLLWQNSMSELMVGENLLSTLKIFNV